MRILSYLLSGLLLLSLTACLDEIEIELPDRPQDGYVIQAKLIKGVPSVAEVQVQRSFQFSSNINQPVTNAEVRLVKEDGFTYAFASNQLNGVYTQALEQANYPIATGDRFRVEVQIADTVMIVSDWETIQEAPIMRNLSWQLGEVERVSLTGLVSRVLGIEFGATTPLLAAGQRAQIRWEFLDAYRVTDDSGQVCYIENPYRNSEVFLLDGRTIAGDTVFNYPLFKAPVGPKHIEGYYLTAYQQAMGEEAFRYWSEIASLLDRKGTVFDDPAGTVSSNFSDVMVEDRIVHGFFTAFSQDTVRLFISREDMGERDFYCPRPSANGPSPGPTVCDDCLLHALGSSLDKPWYWEE